MPRAQFASTHVLPIEHQVVNSDTALADGRKCPRGTGIHSPNLRAGSF